MKILVCFKLPEMHYDMIRETAEGYRVAIAIDKEEAIRSIPDADVLFGFCSPEVFSHAQKLKWFQSQSAGMDSVLFPELIESDVIVTNAAGLYASQAADHAFAMLLSMTRGLRDFGGQRTSRTWGRPAVEGVSRHSLLELEDWTLGIVGMGGFGMEMAKRGKGFSMRVTAVDAHRFEKPPMVDELGGMEALEDLLAESDVVMVACPLTSETHHLLNADRLGKMKPDAYLINVARGGIIEEAALIPILKENRIAGAGLDVFETEPLPADSPLWDLDNVIITPHVAGSSQNRPERTVRFFCKNLRRFMKGEPLQNVVDKRKGF